ncbi:Spermidine hydroxycinnamoyl transferase [Morella rubra]|uniref:Spermidine hydroxycinnamoyl transferase n=1 Tax=Morella rubra TaxID=262757 RepID=A0A6A1WDP5_9ROSI|nr:Spermidine hydroxycinnamoyl transferase [Morella rubra]
MLTIKSASTVFPSEPTPSTILWLSESDQLMQWTHAPLVFFYKSNNDINYSGSMPFSMETMKKSLSRALVHYYPLAGSKGPTTCLMPGEHLEAYSDAKLEELGDFAPTEAVQDLVPKIDYTTPVENWPLLLVQLTRFRCGGVCVGTAISHTVADGRGNASFINLWAKLARGDGLRDDEIPFHDRTVLRSHEPLRPPRFDHIEFTKPPLIIGCSDAKAEQRKETTVTLLRLTKEQIEGLVKEASEFPYRNMLMKRPHTRYEAIASHMWRCACKARSGNDHQPTRVRIGVEVRNRLKPPLPRGYFGNAIFGTVTSTCLYGDLLSKPLCYAAAKIKEATGRMTDEYIRSALDFIRSQEDVSPLRNNFHIRGYSEAPFLGNPNLSIGSWINLQFYAADFGWGKPTYVGPGLLNIDGKSFIMPSPEDDGSLIIALRLQTEYMDAFKKYFYQEMFLKKSFAGPSCKPQEHLLLVYFMY